MTRQDLLELLQLWDGRLASYREDRSDYASGYRDALRECLDDILCGEVPVEQSPDFLPPDETKSYVEKQEADRWLSSVEAHERTV